MEFNHILIYFVAMAVIPTCILSESTNNQIISPTGDPKTFMYFAYGSNLFSKRIHIKNPLAKRFSIGKLDGYRLDFFTQSDTWKGASATIVEDPSSAVWGAIWEIDISNSDSLDDQEGVHLFWYHRLNKTIETINGDLITCRVYQQVTNPDDKWRINDIPVERQPSFSYLQAIKIGAIDSQLPKEYIAFLDTIPHNGNSDNIYKF